MKHFLLIWPRLGDERIGAKELQPPYIQDEEERIGIFSFVKENLEDKEDVLHRVWKMRGKILKETNLKKKKKK